MSSQRWPDKSGWDEMATAVEVLAAACGAEVFCSQKYEHLRVEIQKSSNTVEQSKALDVLVELVEQASDR
jgi:hypothetical protein